MAASSPIDIAALAPMQCAPWIGWTASLQLENDRLRQELAMMKAALHEPSNRAEADTALGQTKNAAESERTCLHLSLDRLLPRISASQKTGCYSLEGKSTPETHTPQSSPIGSGRTTPGSLTPPPGVSFPADFPFACPLPAAADSTNAYPGSDVMVPPGLSTPLELLLEDSLSPFPSLRVAAQLPPVGFRPPPGLPPPGSMVVSSIWLPQEILTMEQRTSVEHVNSMSQTKPSLSRDLQSAVSEHTTSSTVLADASEETASGLNEQSCVVDGAACTSSEDKASPTGACASEVQDVHGTTVIMRNIPFEYTRDTVLELIDRQGFNGLYDLLCLPVDFQTELNHGYVFINFVTLEDAEGFKKHFEGFSDWSVQSESVCEVKWFDSAHNIDSHIQRYRDSPLMHESVEDRFKPVLFKDGLRIPFPESTKKIRAPRRSKFSKGEKGVEPGAKQRC